MNLLRCFGDLLIFNKFVSSAKWWTLQCFMATLRSFMYIRKSNGPNTDPWGTPLVIVDIFELKPLLKQTVSNQLNMIQTIYLTFLLVHNDGACRNLLQYFCGEVHTEKIPHFVSKKLIKNLLIDFYISNMFLYIILVAKFNQYSKENLAVFWNLFQKEYQEKQGFFVLARPLYSIEIKLVLPCFVKFIKMNSWMSKLSSDTKLSMHWTKFDFDIQVYLFIELPIYLQQTSVQIIMAANFSLHVF